MKEKLINLEKAIDQSGSEKILQPMKEIKFETIGELIKDDLFIECSKKVVSKLITARLSRPEPKQGYRYKRDWYDRMYEGNMMNIDFFFKNIEKVKSKTSLLSSEVRGVLIYIFENTLLMMVSEYNSIGVKIYLNQNALNK